MSPGLNTSEFKVMVATVLGFLAEGHVLPDLSVNQTIVICVAIASYILSRGLAKNGTH